MRKVVHLASPCAGTRVHTSAQSPAPAMAPTATKMPRNPSPVDRQAAIENALTMALYFVRRTGESPANLWAATARTNRALTLLKQASQGNAIDGPASALGRA
jgi:hypothetical protein